MCSDMCSDIAAKSTRLITIVIPVYNEGEAIQHNLPIILTELEKIDSTEFQLLIVDDGSVDNTAAIVKDFCEQNKNIELISLNRNFGKEAAVHAGLDYSHGDAVIVMDSDLQHPPNLIQKMVTLWQEGIDVVEACKSTRGKESLISRGLAEGFYLLFYYLTKLDIKNKSDFKLLDRVVVDAYCDLPERKRFFRGIVSWMGFTSAKLFFDVPERQYGESRWPRLKLLQYSISSMTSFTSAPLHLVTLLGFACFFVGFIIGGVALYDKFTGNAVSGFTTVILLILFVGSIIMVSLGQIGIYIEQIFNEVKNRPAYIINRRKSHLKKGN